MAEVWIALPLYGGRAMEPEGAEWTTSPLVIDRMRYRSDGVGYRPHGHTHVFVMPADGGTPRQLTSRASDHGGESSHDGRPVQGWLAKPPGFDSTRKYPLILEIHGGPFANHGPRLAPEVQLYAAAGYLVLYTNPRGSTSYGGEFGPRSFASLCSDPSRSSLAGLAVYNQDGFPQYRMQRVRLLGLEQS